MITYPPVCLLIYLVYIFICLNSNVALINREILGGTKESVAFLKRNEALLPR